MSEKCPPCRVNASFQRTDRTHDSGYFSVHDLKCNQGYQVFFHCPHLNAALKPNCRVPLASQELQSAFASYASDSSAFALLVTISSESLQPHSSIPFSSSRTFESSLPSLSDHLDPKTPIYLFLRRRPEDSSFIAITYVPSTAPVRSKTLFASTRSTLVRELGQEKISRQVFCTDAHEILDPKEWTERDGVTISDDATRSRDDLLTREEKELQGVKRAEEEERHGTSGKDIGWGGGTGKPGSGGSVGMKMKMDDEVQAALRTLAEDGQVVQLVR